MNNLFLILWCYVFSVLVETVVLIEPVKNEDRVAVKIEIEVEVEVSIEGDNIYSSAMKIMLTSGSISKLHVYVADTFYVDDDLQLTGVKELKIFTNIWNNTQPVVFDLSGSNGASQQASINGLAGQPGKNGTDGGNFFALANKIINGDYLTVKSDGGNGANGQDGGTSADIFVLLNVDNDNYPSGWFSSGGDLYDYYKRYFDNRGYNAEISEVDDYTSLYAVFVHEKKASFNVRLHPQKCCGTTGIGGVGGFGGRRGNFQFKYTGNNNTESTPKFVGNDGFNGKPGKDGKLCENLALDVHIAAELKRVVFIAFPLHYSLSSHFNVLNHTKSSKCSPVYVSSNETTVSSASSEPTQIETVSSGILSYKKFLLENMNNDTLTTMVQEAYRAIDENQEINDENSLSGLVLEALELERNYFVLKNSINMIPLYRRLFQRIKTGKMNAQNEQDSRVRQYLRSIFQQKLSDLRLAKNSQLYLMNLSYIESITNAIEYGNEDVPIITDVSLQKKLNKLRFLANGNHILGIYHRAIEQFRLSYFPFAVDYLKHYRLSAKTSAYSNLDHIIGTTINNLKVLSRNIESIRSTEEIWTINNLDGTDPQDAFYVWENKDFRDEIRSLFEGKEITLLSDIKLAKKQFNAIKFNTIDLVFRSSEQSVTDQLNDVLKSFNVRFKHPGRSLIRCNGNFYEMISDPMSLEVSFEKDEHLAPMTRSGNYAMLRYNDPILSPYTLWQIQLLEEYVPTRNISDLIQFSELDIDIEFHGFGRYIEENATICEGEKLAKFYTQIVG
ncbi:uncharacterized protein LOC119085609 [Bradysia coprophila]|uniref:uncharacterized protein LOC119085609 n=1 Tax=Bradysia coprophila TaxID=38358 RepID=UPI00187D8366|nr:uncharacterized protein LOC119085609 [Bradysia coprophila]